MGKPKSHQKVDHVPGPQRKPVKDRDNTQHIAI